MKTISLLFFISIFVNSVFCDEVKSVSVMEGDSLTLHTDFTDTQADDVTVVWTFGPQKSTIAKINREPKGNKISIYDDVLDGRFIDRLQLNNQSGDLNITNITTQHPGVYEVKITVRSKIIQKRFNVNGLNNPGSDQLKSVSVKDADSVTLHTDVLDIKKYDVIQWRFQGSRIAHFNKSASEISENDDIHDQGFRDKLQLDVQTGSLKIKNIRMDLSGLYEVEIRSTSSSYTIHQSFTVTVSGEVKSMTVMMGDPLTIYTDVPDIKTYDQILLIFGYDDRIAEVNKHNKQFTLYGRIRDGLTLNDQTGDLTITDIKNEDTGLYELKLSSSRRSIQRRFSVNVNEQGLSPGAVAGIYVLFILLAAAAAGGGAAGVIYYRRKITEAKQQLDEIQPLKVYEGKSADLKTEVTDIKGDDVIEWRFRETLIAEINPANKSPITYDDDDLFRDKLGLNHQTGDLTINDISEEHDGVYTLKVIRDGKTSFKRFNVFVRDEIKTLEVYEGESVDLKTETDIKRVEKIEWRFEETLIAEINTGNKSPTTSNDDLFRDKLKLNHKTGDLNINDIRQKHTGVYKLKIIRDGETSYKRFNVFVRDEIKPLQVYERESVDLKTDSDIQKNEKIEWRFGETLIAEINPANKSPTTSNDDLFRDKLKVNHQTGDLNINDIREKHTGVYKLKITRDGETSYKRFNVFVRDEIKPLQVYEGESVDLKTEVKDIKTDDVIEWRFRETLIAEINPANNISRTYDDDLFRDKLKLNHKTGDLNINDIRQKHGGDYKLKITRGGKTSDKRSIVIVRDEIQPLQVYEGESVDLETEVKDIKTDDLIEWRFEETLIAEINPANKSPTTSNDDLFRDKLKLNRQTGDLNINHIREEHTGVYKLRIIRDGKTSDKRFNVFVRDEIKPLKVYEGESVDLKTEVKNINRDDLIEWRFGETLIAKINPANNICRTYDGDLFIDKLKVNHQTGDLNINDIREEHTGVCKLKITRDGKTSYKRFTVFVRACAGKVKPVLVNEGESYTLKTDLTDIKRVDLMEWTFGDDKTLIAKINPANNIFRIYDDDNDLFRDNLTVNSKTGDLNINDIREDHTGVYTLKIIRGEETSYKRFNVSVKYEIKPLQVYEGESVHLKTKVKDIQRVKKIEWRFGETLIAIINPVNNIFSTYDGDKGLFRDKLKVNPQTGDLKIKDIRDEHKGFYKLKIIRDGKTSDRRIGVFFRASKKEDSVKVEMEPLLNNSGQ